MLAFVELYTQTPVKIIQCVANAEQPSSLFLHILIKKAENKISIDKVFIKRSGEKWKEQFRTV